MLSSSRLDLSAARPSLLALLSVLAVTSLLAQPAAAGLQFQAPFSIYDMGAYTARLLTGDFDEDGRPDVVVITNLTSYGAFMIALQNPDGTLGSPVPYTGPAPTSYNGTVGDVNGDGHLDVVTANGPYAAFTVFAGDGHGSFAAPAMYGTAGNAQAAAIADMNKDGTPDVVIADYWGNRMRVYLGLPGGGFATPIDIPSETYPIAIAVGDVNADTKPDIAVTTDTYTATAVHLGDGTGGSSIRQTVTPLSSTQLAVAVTNFDGDGYDDVVVANSDGIGFSAWRGGLFALTGPRQDYEGPYGPSDLAVGDVDNDGLPDVCLSAAAKIWAYRSLGTSFGSPITSHAPAGATFIRLADMNVDGVLDAVTCDGSGHVAIVIGNGDGTFGHYTGYATSAPPAWMASGDLNGDGLVDLATANNDDSISLLFADGLGGFVAGPTLATGSSPVSILIADVDGDADGDLVTCNSGSNDVSVLIGDGTGGFAAHVEYATSGSPADAAAADLNGDGNLDLAVANNDLNSVSVLHGNGSGAFAAPVDWLAGDCPNAVAVADLDGDGYSEILTANLCSGDVTTLPGLPGGGFDSPTSAPMQGSSALAVRDMDADGRPDLIACGGSYVSVRPGIAGGGFGDESDYLVMAGAASIAIADFDGDGRLDIAVSGKNTPGVTVLLGTSGAAPVREPHPQTVAFGVRRDYGTGAGPVCVLALDVDGNGLVDLCVADTYASDVSVLLNAPPVAVSEEPVAGVGAWSLSVRPTPASSKLTVTFRLAAPTSVTIQVRDVMGRAVADLTRDRRAAAGWNAIAWDGRNASGTRVPAGIYFVRLETADGRAITTRAVLTR